MVDRICVHEDDWGMRNLHPLAARVEIERDIEEAAAAGERNLDPSGIGYTALYMTEPPSTDYAKVGLLLSDAERVLSPIMPRVRSFSATIFSMI